MIQEILNNCTIEGNIVRLPEGQLERDIYEQVADKLKKIGGKWVGRKTQTFVFPHDPSELLAKIQSGEKVNLKKDFQFFETPDALANRLVELADLRKEFVTLEPSAGYGAIIWAIPRNIPVNYYEINPLCLNKLVSIENTVYMGADFLQSPEHSYMRIIANPPFSKNQDIDHIRKMYEVLAPDGRLVSVASTHWRSSANKKEKEFRNWLATLESATVIDLEAGTFKESGTEVASVIIIIDK